MTMLEGVRQFGDLFPSWSFERGEEQPIETANPLVVLGPHLLIWQHGNIYDCAKELSVWFAPSAELAAVIASRCPYGELWGRYQRPYEMNISLWICDVDGVGLLRTHYHDHLGSTIIAKIDWKSVPKSSEHEIGWRYVPFSYIDGNGVLRYIVNEMPIDEVTIDRWRNADYNDDEPNHDIDIDPVPAATGSSARRNRKPRPDHAYSGRRPHSRGKLHSDVRSSGRYLQPVRR